MHTRHYDRRYDRGYQLAPRWEPEPIRMEPAFVPPTPPPVPAGCAGHIRRFKRKNKSNAALRKLVERLDQRADRSERTVNDERQRSAVEYIIRCREEYAAALAAHRAKTASERDQQDQFVSTGRRGRSRSR